MARYVRRLRTAGSHQTRPLRRVAKALGRRLARRTGVYILVSHSDTRSIVAAIIDEIEIARRAGIPAEVLVFRFHPASGRPDALTAASASVAVRYFWIDAAPNGGGARPRHTTRLLVPVPMPTRSRGTRRTCYFSEGKPVLATVENAHCTLVDYYSRNGVVVQRDEIDADGRLVRIIDFDTATGHPAGYRYLDADGRCWLSVSVGPRGGLGGTQQHHPTAREFEAFEVIEAEWVAERVAATPRPLVLATSDVTEEIGKQVIATTGVSLQRIP